MSGQSTYLLVLLSVVFLSCSFAHPSIRQREDVRPICNGCGYDCDKCEYGVTISALCGIPECKKGPGEICGGPSDSWGVCAEGTYCNKCNKCTGCSLESELLTCYSDPCPPHRGMEARHLGSLYDFPTAK